MGKKYISIFVILISFVLAGCAGYSPVISTQTLSSQEEVLQRRLDKSFTEYFPAFSGSVLVARDDRAILNKGYGMANLEGGIPNDGKTAFHLVSLTKAFTAMAVIMLEEEGLLDLEDDVTDYFPGLPNLDGISLHHLMTHTSGIEVKLYCWEVLKTALAGGRPETAPGGELQYSNGNYILLGKVIEAVSEESYTEFIDRRILKPLGMNGTGWVYAEIPEEKRALGYRFAERENRTDIHPEPLEDLVLLPDDYPAGGLYSTAEDLFRWHRALGSDFLVKKETIEKIFTRYVPVDPEVWEVEADEAFYGYGWCLYEKGPGEVFATHEGAFPGYSVIITRGVESDQFIIILSNLNYVLDEIVEMNRIAMEALSQE